MLVGHVLDHVLDYMLDHMIIGFMTTTLYNVYLMNENIYQSFNPLKLWFQISYLNENWYIKLYY